MKEIYEKVFESTIDTVDESVDDSLNDLFLTVLTEDVEDDVIEEAAKDFGKKIKGAFDAIIKAIKDLCEKIIEATKSKMQQMAVNKKLKELKKIMANDKTIDRMLEGGKVGALTTTKFYVEYSKYISEVTKICKTAAKKNYQSYDDYESYINDSYEKLDHKYAGIMCSYEQDLLEASVKDAIEYTEKEYANINKIENMLRAQSEAAINNLSKEAEKSDSPEKAHLYQRAASAIANASKKAMHSVAKHPFLTLAAIGATIGVAKSAVKYKEAKIEGSRAENDSKFYHIQKAEADREINNVSNEYTKWGLDRATKNLNDQKRSNRDALKVKNKLERIGYMKGFKKGFDAKEKYPV